MSLIGHTPLYPLREQLERRALSATCVPHMYCKESVFQESTRRRQLLATRLGQLWVYLRAPPKAVVLSELRFSGYAETTVIIVDHLDPLVSAGQRAVNLRNMTTSQLAPADAISELPLRRQKVSGTALLHPGPAFEPAVDSTEPDELQATVTAVLDDIIRDAVLEASLSAEKKNVQRLITNLVTRVRNESTNGELSRNRTSTDTANAAGVPVLDQRPRRLAAGSPVTWCQTMDYVTVNIAVGDWVRKNHVVVRFFPGSLQINVLRETKGSAVVEVGGPLLAQVDVDGCIWSLEGSGKERMLTIELEKGKEQWWGKLFMSDDPADYRLDDRALTFEPTDEPTQGPQSAVRKPGDIVTQDTQGVGDLDCTTVGSGQLNSCESTDGKNEVDSEAVNTSEGKGSTDADLGDTVESVVREVVANVAEELSESSEAVSLGNGLVPAYRSVGKAGPQQKVLTRADISQLVEKYREVFKKGGPGASDAALQLATFYHHGIGVDQNDANAARLYKYALENGNLDASAAFQLGLIFNQGADGLEPNPAEAVRWWQVSAQLGNSVAMFNLGVMAMNGTGCDMDPVEAIRWFRQAQLLNPQLRPPQFSAAQLEERMAIAAKLRKERMKRALPPEEKLRRREEALQRAQQFAYGAVALAGLGMSAFALRYWWRNRL